MPAGEMKKSLDDLAIFGGTPAFSEALHVGRPHVGDKARFLSRVNDILDRRWLTNNGRYVQEFERRLAGMMSVRHCIATCNATQALQIVVKALDLTGEVIVPAFTFVATAHALRWQGVTPVFCDVDPRTHTIDPIRAEEAITPQTTGIIGVHLWGRACEVDRLEHLTRRRELKLLFDAAHAFGSTYHGRPIGRFGNAEVFSFHATKCVNSFEGGAVTTDDDVLATRARLMRNFGFAGHDAVVCVGTNGKMNEVSAAMGLTSLEDFEGIVAVNKQNHRLYRYGLAGVNGVEVLPGWAGERSNYQYVVLEVDSSLAGVSRDNLLRILWTENVLARRYFYPGCHRVEPYRSAWAGRRLPETERLAARVLCLPTGTAIGPEEIGRICEVIRIVVEHAPESQARLMCASVNGVARRSRVAR